MCIRYCVSMWMCSLMVENATKPHPIFPQGVLQQLFWSGHNFKIKLPDTIYRFALWWIKVSALFLHFKSSTSYWYVLPLMVITKEQSHAFYTPGYHYHHVSDYFLDAGSYYYW